MTPDDVQVQILTGTDRIEYGGSELPVDQTYPGREGKFYGVLVENTGITDANHYSTLTF